MFHQSLLCHHNSLTWWHPIQRVHVLLLWFLWDCLVCLALSHASSWWDTGEVLELDLFGGGWALGLGFCAWPRMFALSVLCLKIGVPWNFFSIFCPLFHVYHTCSTAYVLPKGFLNVLHGFVCSKSALNTQPHSERVIILFLKTLFCELKNWTMCAEKFRDMLGHTCTVHVWSHKFRWINSNKQLEKFLPVSNFDSRDALTLLDVIDIKEKQSSLVFSSPVTPSLREITSSSSLTSFFETSSFHSSISSLHLVNLGKWQITP